MAEEQKQTNEIDEVINMDTSENDKWANAKSLEVFRMKQDKMAELSYMRELFNCYLPTGPNLSAINCRFDELQQAIDNGIEPGRDNFEDFESNTSSSYKYFSASLFKEHASRHIEKPCGQDLENRQYDQDSESETQDISENLECIQLDA